MFLAAALAVTLAGPPETPPPRPAEVRLAVTPPAQAALAGDLMFASFPNISWKLDLWASSEVPRYGYTIYAKTLVERTYSPLPGGYQYSNVDTGSLVVDPPPAAT